MVNKQPESRLQIACVKWFRLAYRQYEKLLIHIPNGGSRDLFTAQRLKAEGVMPGVADIALFIPNQDYHGLFIELKVKPNRQSTHQKEWQKVIEPQGYKYQIAYSFDEFQEIIQNYIGNP